MNTILTTVLVAAGLCASPSPIQQRERASAPSTTAYSGNTSENTAEGAEILRRILVDALDKAFQPEEKGEKSTRINGMGGGPGLITRLWVGHETVQHSRVFHMPDVGLFFALDASLPIVSKEEKRDPDAKGEKSRDDEWERARRELRGDVGGGGNQGFFVFRNRAAKEVEIDQHAVDQLIDLVLKTLARHAGRIEGLGSRETLTVAFRLSGRGSAWSEEAYPGAEVWSSSDDEDGGEEESADVELSKAYSYVLASGANVREQNLVIRVPLADLAADADLGRLRERAQINRY